MVPDAEVIDNVEEVLLVSGQQDSLELGTEELQYIGQVTDGVPPISIRRTPAPKLACGRGDPALHILWVYLGQLRHKKWGEVGARES